MNLKNLFKKKENLSNTKIIDIESIKNEISELEKELDNNISNIDKAELLNKLGIFNLEIGNIDKSIDYFEQCLEIDRTMMSPQTKLMKAYNIKRKESVENKNPELSDIYMKKIDDLMALSKDAIRYGKK
ncbi:MAG: hypothetical protein KBF12_06695 [Sebaldella sp.]|nr:hypothetical protein [Sebaldella sp.]